MIKPYYEEAGITIYHGDCRQILPQIGTFDLLLTDPPYGVKKGYESYADGRMENDNLISEIVPIFENASPRRLITCGIGNIWSYPRADWVLCWSKPNSMSRSSVANANIWEPVLVYGCKGFGRDGITVSIAPQLLDHPCPKPLKLFSWLISKATNEGEAIIDPFMGSGTTLEAAKNLGRRAVGVDIEEKYCEIAANRLRQSVLNFEGVA